MQPVLRLPPEKHILRIPIFSEVRIIRTFPRVSYRGADESLARPVRKQANVSVRMAWISFGALPGRKRNLMTARISILLKSFASLTCFRACFRTDLAKDFSAPRYLYTWHADYGPSMVEIYRNVWRERKNQKMQQLDVYYQLLSQHVSGIIMPIFRRTTSSRTRAVHQMQ